MSKQERIPRKQKALETKESLLKSALKLFSQKSYDSVSVDDIVALAGTSKGTFYTHFKSKDQIIIESFKRIDEYYLHIIDDLKEQKTAGEKLMLLLEGQIDYVVQTLGIDVIRIVYTSQLAKTDSVSILIDKNRPLHKILLNIVREGQKSGEFRDDLSPEYITIIIGRCMRAIFYDWCITEYDFMKEGKKFFSSFVLKGLQK